MTSITARLIGGPYNGTTINNVPDAQPIIYMPERFAPPAIIMEPNTHPVSVRSKRHVYKYECGDQYIWSGQE